MESYTAKTTNKPQPHIRTWMNLINIMLSERRQTKELRVFPFI